MRCARQYLDLRPITLADRSIEGQGLAESERSQKGDQVGALLLVEDEAELPLVVAHHVLERRGDAVVEVRRPRRQRAERRRLEPPEIVPQPSDVTAARVGQLTLLACGAI